MISLIPAPATAAPATLNAAGAQTLVEQLGSDRTGGMYIDTNGRLVVAVTDQAAARSVHDAGGVAELVTFSTDHLTAIDTEFTKSLLIPGVGFGVDPSENKVTVEVDSTVTGDRLTRVESAVAPFGDAVQVVRTAGTSEPAVEMRGGQGISRGSGNHCTAGFNIRDRATGERFMLTAGHCLDDGYAGRWYKTTGGNALGRSYGWSYPGNDYGFIDYRSDVTPPGVVRVSDEKTQQITHSRAVVDGEGVDRVGYVSDDLRGVVLVPSETHTYSNGETVSGMIKTSQCVRRGDSGGPLFAGTAALGVTSGGTGLDDPCSSSVDRRSWYQPVGEALSAFVMEVY